jgi:hypothetical protein
LRFLQQFLFGHRGDYDHERKGSGGCRMSETRRGDDNEFDRAAKILEASWADGSLGSAAIMAGCRRGRWPSAAERARIVEDAVAPAQAPGQSEAAPKYHIKFAVCGMSHDHI